MRRTFGIGLAVAVFALATGCGKKPDTTGPGGPAATGIEGGWTLVAIEAEGKPQVEAVKNMPVEEKTIRATGDKMVKTVGGKEDALSYKLNPTRTPPEVDLTKALPDGKTENMYGIYKLEGGTLTICATVSDTPADRPKEFKTAPGDKRMIMTLKKD